MVRILIVEDERKILRSLVRAFQTAGHEVVGVDNGLAGYELATKESFDCIILDVLLPGRNGLDVLADLRKGGKSIPVLILTARDAVEDRVLGLDSGADDYVIKPFAVAELLARVRVLLRRGRTDRETVLQIADLEMDLIERRVTRGDQEISLTPKEFDVLEYFLRYKNEVVTRDMLGRDVWKEPNYALTNVIEVCINSIRRKIELPGTEPLLHTLRGQGYCLRD
jgi:two-component system OmpR family response regulator